SRELRAGTNRFRAAPGGDHRSGLHGRDELRGDRAANSASPRAAIVAAPFQVEGGPTPHVSHGLTDGRELPRKQLERGTRGKGSRRRPFAVGEDGLERLRGG